MNLRGAYMNEFRIKKSMILVGLAVSLVIAYVSELSVSHQATLQKIVWVLLAAVGVLCVILYRNKALYSKGFLLINLAYLPYILGAIYTVVLSIFVGNKYGQVSQAITTSMFIVVDALAAAALIALFKNRAATVVFWGIVFSYSLSLIIALRDIGLAETIKYYTSGDFLGYYRNGLYFEKHDVGVAVVPFVLYYFYTFLCGHKDAERYRIPKIIVLLIIMFLCGKRVAMLALAIGILIALIFASRMGGKSKIALTLLLSAFVFCFVYIVLIKTGAFSRIVNILGINSMARTDVYDWFRDWYSLSPFYAGYGFQYVHKFMEAGMANSLVNSFGYLHNSILQIYLELGFVGFFIWYGYVIVIHPMLVKKFCDEKVFLFWTVVILPYILMLMVDNVMTYPLFMLSMYTVLAQFMFNDENQRMRSAS